MKLQQLYIIIIIVSISIVSSCNTDVPIVANPKSDIANYHESMLKVENKNTDFNKAIKVYIDYSGGMFLPIDQCYDLIDEIITITNRESTVFYNVGLGAPRKIDGNVLEPNHPKNPRQNSNYTDSESYLDDAIDSITTDDNSQSIFITDFELYRDGRFDPSPWATLNFEKWLSEGHQIDVFAKAFSNKNGKEQYLYLILFTPKNYPTDEAIITRLEKEGYTKGRDLEWFSFSDKLGSIEQNGSYNKLIAPIRENENYYFSYYDFNISNIQRIPKKSYLFENISFKNISQIYKDIRIDYDLTDITDSFPNKQKGEAIEEKVFDVFINKNQESYDFKIKLSDKFDGLNVHRRLYRIDFYLTGANPTFDEERMTKLEWKNTEETTFSSLNISLQEAVSRIKVKRKLLYTYYIELSI